MRASPKSDTIYVCVCAGVCVCECCVREAKEEKRVACARACQLQRAVRRHQQVVGLDVAVEDPVGVAALKREQRHANVRPHVAGAQAQAAVLDDRLQVALHKLEHLATT